MTRLSLMLPELGEDQPVPDLVLYLTACLMRSHDAEFVAEQVAWLKERG